MPITPFHFGPGLLIKSAAPKKISFFVFVISQILIDFETAWNMFSGNERLHTFLHTYIGSLVIVGICIIAKKPLCWSRSQLLRVTQFRLNEIDINFRIVFFSSLIGVWSHVFLDSIMHADIRPFMPFSQSNGMLGFLSLPYLHLGCYAAGILGVLILIGRRIRLGRIPITSHKK